MNIYVWPDGSWLYQWEVHGFTLEHSATLEGGRWVDVDTDSRLTLEEERAVLEALGD